MTIGERIDRAVKTARSYLRLCPVSSRHGWLTKGSDGRFECLACGYVEQPCDCD